MGITATTKKQKSIIAVVGAIAVALVLVGVSRRPPPAVPIVQLSRQNVSQTISSNGTIQPIDPFIARAQFPTFVSKVAAVAGQAVHRGQLILTLDASDIKSQLAQTRADLIASQTSLRNAKSGGAPADVAQLQSDLAQAQADVASLERSQKSLESLLATQAATKDEVAKNATDLAKAQARLQSIEARQSAMKQNASVDAEQAELRVNQDQEAIRSLEDKLSSATVMSTTNGTLYSLPVHTGDYVKVGDELADMADLHKVRVLVYVDEPDMGMLAPGQTVQVTWDALPGRMWTGQTEQVPKQVVPHGMRSVAELFCSVDNGKLELLPNTNVDVKILVRESKNALVVPRGAVRDDNGQRYVYVFNDGAVKRRNVVLGVSNASNYEVLSGLSDGDRVAVPQDRTLHDGMNVRPAGES
ncbi:MAG TPA: efflux RND transporter periplasmic adaptor subunit [Candidatus Acidoferrales bacterium]|nr:efflux RND transporter periplasmic adaptor subunit [Candidatus Acidoferrales bacterium]